MAIRSALVAIIRPHRSAELGQRHGSWDHQLGPAAMRGFCRRSSDAAADARRVAGSQYGKYVV